MTSTSGTTLVARYPTSTMNARLDAMGTRKLTTVGSFSASSCESNTRAMTSSMTAAAMMSCPVGVPSTPPSWRTLSDMPMEVGARHAPTAKQVFALMSNTSFASVAPMASGTSDPKKATFTPRAPTSESDARSTSTPASRTIRTSPNSPTIISASGLGAMFNPWGPTAMPARISPTNAGRPNFSTLLPTTQKMSRMPQNATSSSNVNGTADDGNERSTAGESRFSGAVTGSLSWLRGEKISKR